MGTRKWILKIPLLLLFLTLTEFIKLCISTPADTITPTQFLQDGGDVLVSPGEKFALGFFSPAGNSDRRYIGIWFNKVSEQTVVWVANRDNPLNDTSGVVSFDSAGNLILTSSSAKNNNSPLWSTNDSVPSGVAVSNSNVSVVAKLLDTGNLVIIHKKTQRLLWQSFDYPTDTLLASMKFGLDRRTGVNRVMTSWRSKDDPGTGPYTYGVDPSTVGTPQVFLFKGSEKWWRAGPWIGLRWTGIPEMVDSFVFNTTYVDDADEISFVDDSVTHDASLFWRFALDDSGVYQGFTWRESERHWFKFWSAPKDICDSYKRCGAYSYCDPNPNWNASEFFCKCLPGFKPRSPQDWILRDASGGCVRERGAGSACGAGEGFLKLGQVKVPDTRVARVDMSLSMEACEQKCLRNCSCVAYTSGNVSADGTGSGCLAWYGDLVDIKVLSGRGQDLYIRVDADELANARRKSSKGFHGVKRTIVLAIVPVILVALLLVFVGCCSYKRLSKLRGHTVKRNHHLKSFLYLPGKHKTNMEINEGEGSRRNIDLPFFSLREVKSATNNFSNELGKGGFGVVYKGQLSNGQEIAVKRLSKHSSQGADEFKNEVLLIAKLQHRNLVKLLGCCIDEEELMLIYEYLPNKSLDSYIFDQSMKVMLDWRKRYDIIMGIARGILYLHQDSRLRIVHRDLKASNILLDGDMNPKISDFGMARIFGGNQTQANTNRVVGTFGYMSPEYALDGLFSMKSDIFSFGVILLEIISGKKNHAFFNDDPLTNLIRYIWDMWNEDKVLEIVDSSMGDSWQDSEVLRCIQLGLLCVQESAIDRPTMLVVLSMLSGEATLPSPKKPVFAVRRSDKDIAAGSTSCSKNEISITIVEPR